MIQEFPQFFSRSVFQAVVRTEELRDGRTDRLIGAEVLGTSLLLPFKPATAFARVAIRRWTHFGLGCALLVPAPRASQVVPAESHPQSEAGQAANPRDTAEWHLGRGYDDLKNDRYEAAVREFRAALQLDPRLVFPARFPLGVALFQLQKPKEARAELEAVHAAVGDHPNIMYYLGRLDLVEGNWERAVENLSKAAARPPFPDTAYYLGSAYLKKGELDLAEKWLRKAAALTPRDFHVQDRLGVLYRDAGREHEAQKAFAQAAELRARDAQASQQRLDCIEKLEKSSLEDARPVCEKLFDPDDVEKLTMLGTIYGQHGLYGEALKPLRRAAELSPRSPQTQYNVALAYFRLGRYEEARAPLEGVAKLWPDLPELQAFLGAVLYRLHEEPSAYRALSHAHELNPQDQETASLLYEVAIVLAQKSLADNQYAASLEYWAKAAELRPADPEPHRRLAQIYGVTGQQERAAEERREIERLTPPDPAKPK